MMFNIGIVNISYDTVNTLGLAFESWERVKREKLLSDLISNVYISSRHTCFPETFSLGYSLLSTDGTVQKLQELNSNGVIDSLVIYDKPVEEQIAWSDNLPFLISNNVNLLWMVGSDEIFTVEDIEKILKFVKRNELTDIFKINFKNYFGFNKYTKSFIAPRIWNMTRNGGVKEFWKDDLVKFGNGKLDHEVSTITIPYNYCHPSHYSWSLPPNCGDEFNLNFQKRKLGFQAKRYVNCSYKLSGKGELEYNKEYYQMIGQPVPEVYYD